MQSLGISTSIVCTTYTICRRSGNVGLKLLIWQTKTFQSNGNPTKIISNQIWNFLCSSIFGIFLYTHSCCTRSDILFINSNDLDFCLCLSYEYLSKCFRNENFVNKQSLYVYSYCVAEQRRICCTAKKEIKMGLNIEHLWKGFECRSERVRGKKSPVTKCH